MTFKNAIASRVLMVHSHCTGPGPGTGMGLGTGMRLGTMSLYVMLCTVHRDRDKEWEWGPMGSISISPFPVPFPVPAPCSVNESSGRPRTPAKTCSLLTSQPQYLMIFFLAPGADIFFLIYFYRSRMRGTWLHYSQPGPLIIHRLCNCRLEKIHVEYLPLFW